MTTGTLPTVLDRHRKNLTVGKEGLQDRLLDTTFQRLDKYCMELKDYVTALFLVRGMIVRAVTRAIIKTLINLDIFFL